MPQDPRSDGYSSIVTSRPSAFDLPDRLAAKADPTLISADDEHFSHIEARLDESIRELSERLDAELKVAASWGQAAVERDLEVRRLGSRQRSLRRYGLDLCLGRMVADDGTPVYIGRFGLNESDGRRLLVDWRSPAAEPFFGATRATPMGLASRRRYRWSRGRVTDYWDEVLTDDGLDGNAALDDQSAFIASLGASRSTRMRDVLGTLQADQDAIIRAASSGALVVDGGPGTGKTVVALHRSAYLLYSDPHLAHADRGLLFVGPSRGYLAYTDDVLPSLGEDSVQTCTLRDLVEEGSQAPQETDERVTALKSSARMLAAIEAAARYHERPPTGTLPVETEWADTWLDASDWAEAFDSTEPGAPHNEGRDQAWEQLVAILVDKHDGEVPEQLVRSQLVANPDLRAAFARAWPLLDPAGVVGDLWSVPAFLRRCAPWLAAHEIQLLQRDDARAFTTADLPLLDAARSRIGDPEASGRNRRREAARALELERRNRVVDDLIAADDGEGLVTMLRGSDAQNSLIDDAELPESTPDELAGPFAHIVVDEAQELTDAEWQMLRRRCPSGSFTIVGDRAQARHGFTESWTERLTRVGLDRVTVASLSINYRTPEEVMAEAEPVIRAAIPDANVPVSIRSSGKPIGHADVAELASIVDTWLAANPDGIACVIGAPEFPPTPRVRSLSPEESKGLEFDLVVVVAPAAFGPGVSGAVDRYVAMTRATQELVVLGG